MKSLIMKRSLRVGGKKTSVSLEAAFWDGLKEIAVNRNLTLSELVSGIDGKRFHANLSSAIRLFVLDHYRMTIGATVAARDPEPRIPARFSSP